MSGEGEKSGVIVHVEACQVAGQGQVVADVDVRVTRSHHCNETTITRTCPCNIQRFFQL